MTNMEFKTRKELLMKRDDLKNQINTIFKILKNPLMPTDEALKKTNDFIMQFEADLVVAINKFGDFLKSEEYKEEIKFYNS